MHRSKRAETELWAMDTHLFWLLFGIILTITTTVVMIIVKSQFVEYTKVPGELPPYLIADRLLFSGACFSTQSTGPLAIDASRLTTPNFNSCLQGNSNSPAPHRLSFFSADQSFRKIITTSSWNEAKPVISRESFGPISVLSEGTFISAEVFLERQ